MRPAKKTVRRNCLALFAFSLCAALVAGAMPALLTLTVDPYELISDRSRPTSISELAEKDHYPLWKLARYAPGRHDTVVLGDSRARALRDKYWHEIGMPGAINLAYGGATVPEIYETFNLIKADPSIRNFVVGIQLRSMDESHKGGMNRVPEAVGLLDDRIAYLKNWSVAKTALKVFKAENPEMVERLETLRPTLVAAADAAELGPEGRVSLRTLLSPEVCFACGLPRDLRPLPRRRGYGQYDLAGLPLWDGRGLSTGWSMTFAPRHMALYDVTLVDRVLPAKMQRQIDRNGPADWRGFTLSARYWSYLEEMAAWARRNGKNMIFVIPPTVAEMQATIQRHGLADLNIALRVELAKLGTVVDFDYPNALTDTPENFSDAYHFRPTVARAMVGELALRLSDEEAVAKRVAKRRGPMRCPDADADPAALSITENVVMADESNCRIWSRRAL